MTSHNKSLISFVRLTYELTRFERFKKDTQLLSGSYHKLLPSGLDEQQRVITFADGWRTYTDGADDFVVANKHEVYADRLVTRNGNSCDYFDCGKDSVCVGESPNAECRSKCEIPEENPCLYNNTVCVQLHYLMDIVCKP